MLLLVRVMICNNVGYEEDRQKILIAPAYLHRTLKHARWTQAKAPRALSPPSNTAINPINRTGLKHLSYFIPRSYQ